MKQRIWNLCERFEGIAVFFVTDNFGSGGFRRIFCKFEEPASGELSGRLPMGLVHFEELRYNLKATLD